jgi:hypothetical protein
LALQELSVARALLEGLILGKRSKFARIKDDFYPTPRKAVLPLIPYLNGIRSFAEPCVGDGALVRVLEEFGLHCVWQGDIRTGQNALDFSSYGGADAIITNPPYARELMHRMIAHFRAIVPTWLLLESDWAFNLNAAPFIPACTDIVPIGRVKWFAGTRGNSTANHAWYHFVGRHTAGPILHARGRDDVRDEFDFYDPCEAFQVEGA